jgi:hypothetical protein
MPKYEVRRTLITHEVIQFEADNLEVARIISVKNSFKRANKMIILNHKGYDYEVNSIIEIES